MTVRQRRTTSIMIIMFLLATVPAGCGANDAKASSKATAGKSTGAAGTAARATGQAAEPGLTGGGPVTTGGGDVDQGGAADAGGLLKISSGGLWATKTYVNDYADSPDGSKILYRYFPYSGSQPSGRTKRGYGAQMWMCAPDGSGSVKLYDIPDVFDEVGHGSDSMVWIDNARFYYNGILYDTDSRQRVWTVFGSSLESVPLRAWTPPVNGKLFVNIRTGSNAGYYSLDINSAVAPVPMKVLGPSDLRPYLGGNPSEYQFTYLKLSPGGSYLYFVMYYGGKEYGFTSLPDGTGIVALGTQDDTSKPYNGHAIWFDDATLLYPAKGGIIKTCARDGSDIRTVAARGNHLTLSADRKWIAADDTSGHLWLYRVGFEQPVSDLMKAYGEASTAVAGVKTDPHPSFSRDGGRVYFMGRYGDSSCAVYSADISARSLNPDYVPFSVLKRIEAESMELSGYTVATYPDASGGNVVLSKGGSASASLTSDLDTGVYSLKIRYLDDKMGPSQFEVRIGDVVIDTWISFTASTKGGASTLTVRSIIDVMIPRGAVIKVTGSAGGTYTRLDYIEILAN